MCKPILWLTDDMINRKPSARADILEAREAKINNDFTHAKK
jgi:hypothetical protein